jgi:hypothetical protein
MRINVHIERLFVEGVAVTSIQGPQIRAAFENELSRLLTVHGLSEELRQGTAVPRVRAGTIQLGKDNQPASLGRNIARAVHDGIGGSETEMLSDVGTPSTGGVPR